MLKLLPATTPAPASAGTPWFKTPSPKRSPQESRPQACRTIRHPAGCLAFTTRANSARATQRGV